MFTADVFGDSVVVVIDFQRTKAKVANIDRLLWVVATALFTAQRLDVWQFLNWTSQRKELHTSLPAVRPGVTTAASDPKLVDSPTT